MATGRTVRRSVAATNPETGETKWFHDGDTLDGEWANFVDNEAVFEPYDSQDMGVAGSDTVRKTSAGVPEVNSPDPGGAGEHDDTPTAPGGTTGEADYEDLTKSQLEEMLEERDLPKSGTKPELIERLKAHDAANG